MGQIIKSVCISQSIRLRAPSQSHFLIDFSPKLAQTYNPQKEERVHWGSISHQPFLYFVPQNPHFRPRGPETHANIK